MRCSSGLARAPLLAPAGAARRPPDGPRRAPRGDRHRRRRGVAAVPLQRAKRAPRARASTPTTRRRSSSGPTGCSTASAPSRTPCGFGYPTGPQSVAAVAAEATGASLLDAFNGLLLAIPVLTALAALAALEWLRRRAAGCSPPRSPACRTWPPPSSPRAPSRRRRWRCWCWLRGRAGALGRRAAADAASPTRSRAHGRWPDPARGRRASSSTASRGSPGSRSPCPIWLALERRHRAAAHRRRGALRDGARRHRAGDRRGGGRGGRGAARSRPRSSRGSSARSATCRPRRAGSARRSSPARRSGSGRRATSGSSAATSSRAYPAAGARAAGSGARRLGARFAAATGAWWRWAPRGDRLRRRQAVRVDLRRGQGARGDGAAGRGRGALAACSRRRGCRARRPAALRARRVVALALGAPSPPSSRSRAAPVGFDQRGDELEQLAGLVQGARSPSSASTASPATGCAGR